MKRIIMLFILLNSIGWTMAQKGMQISITGTPGVSYMLAQNNYYLAPNPALKDPSKELDYKAKFSYNAFLNLGYMFKDKHGLVLNAGYCSEGQNYKDEFKWKIYGLEGIHEKTVDFKFVGIGLLYRFSPILKGQKEKNPNGDYDDGRYKIRMKILGGVEADILLNASMSYKVTNPDGTLVDMSQYPYISTTNGGYAPYYALGKPASQKDYFVPVQAGLVIKYGFDYFFEKNVFIGVGLNLKMGLNDINDKAYRVHPDYKKSKNYFVGLNVDIGYNIQKDKSNAKGEKYKNDTNTKKSSLNFSSYKKKRVVN